MPDLSLNIIGNNLAGDAIKGVAGSLKDMGAAAFEFGKSSLLAYSQSQQALAQLERVAGDATGVFAAQAAQMQELLGVSDDTVFALQKLTLTFGAAQTQVEPTTRAILDYAAATGKDATQAMEMLLRGVESGTGELKKMGITFEATGDKSKDLALATEALSAKYGGAAAADANTLAGRARIANEAFEDLKKGFGEVIADFEQSLGVLDKLNSSLKAISVGLGFDKEANEAKAVNALLEERTRLQEALAAGIAKTRGGDGLTEDQVRLRLIEINMRLKALDLLKQEREGARLSSDGSHDLTAAARSEQKSAAEAAIKEHQKGARDLISDIKRAAKEQVDAYVDGEKETAKEIAAARADATEESRLALAQVHVEQLRAVARQSEAMQKAEEDLWYDFGRRTAEELNKTRDQFGTAGTDIGVALVRSLGAELSQLAEGGEMDIGSFFGDLISTIGGVVGTVVGAVNPLLGATIGAGAGLIGSGIKGATKKKHDGGTIERYHSGGWPGIGTDEVPIIAQEGERMWSRGEVARAGGPAAVDALARNGGQGASTVINVSVVDGENFRQFVEGKGGRAIYNATRTGHGMLAPMLGGG